MAVAFAHGGRQQRVLRLVFDAIAVLPQRDDTAWRRPRAREVDASARGPRVEELLNEFIANIINTAEHLRVSSASDKYSS